MGHLTDTKQGWWHSEIDKSMELIMMRHLHQWQNDDGATCSRYCCFQGLVIMTNGC